MNPKLEMLTAREQLMEDDWIMNRNELQKVYIHQLIDGMDSKGMYQFVYDILEENLGKYSEAELIAEVEDYDPELLEGN